MCFFFFLLQEIVGVSVELVFKVLSIQFEGYSLSLNWFSVLYERIVIVFIVYKIGFVGMDDGCYFVDVGFKI